MNLILVLVAFSTSVSAVYTYTRTLTPEHAYAATSSNLNYQARLLNANGSTVADGYYNIRFNLYSSSTGGASLWNEEYYDSNGVTAGNDNRVRVANGYLSVNLASQTAFPALNWDQDMWLTMNIGGSTHTATPTYDGEMTPRVKLTAVPYAFQAKQSETLVKTAGGFTGTVDFGGLTANRTYLFPDTSLATTASPGTICVYNGAASNCPAASGSAYYIQNDTVLQTQSNYYIQARDSGANGTVGAQIRGAANGQTVDLFRLLASDGTVLTAFQADGKLAFGPSGAQDTNLYRSAANTLKTDDALEVVGGLTVSGGATVSGAAINLNDSSNFATNINTGTSTGAVNIGNGAAGAISLTSGSTVSFAGTNATLNTTGQLQLPTTGSTGGILFGGDANLYRSAANTLATDDSFSLLGTGSNLTVQGTGSSTFAGNVDIAGTLAVGTADAVTITAAGLITTADDVAINGGDLTTTAGTFNLLNGATTVNLGTTASARTVNIATGAAAQTVNIGSTDTTSTTTLQAGSGNINFNASQAQFSEVTGTRTLTVQTRTTNVAGSNLTISGGTAGAGASAFSGGALNLQGGNAAGTGNANGASVTIQGGTGVGTGVRGLVSLYASTQVASSTQIYGVNSTIAQSVVDTFGTVPVDATANNLTITLPAPTQNVVGRMLYISAVNGSRTFTIAPSGGVNFLLNANASATFLWNGTGWTNAGVDSGSASFILNQNSSVQSAANFWISGVGRADTSFMAPLFTTPDSVASGNSLSVVFRSGDANTGSGNTSGNVTVKSGDGVSGNASSGSVTVDAGVKTGTGTAGSISIGTANASAVTISRVGVLTRVDGNLTIGASAGSGTTLTNNGATLNSTLALTNFATGGSIGTAASTVDVYTSISVLQTTAGQTLTIPVPTSNPTTVFGRILYLSNVGTASFILGSTTVNPGTTATLIWSNTDGAATTGESWQFAGADGNGILNQNTADQTANFRISGTGQANTGLLSPNLERASSGTLSIGTTANSTSISIGRAGNTTTNAGALTVSELLTGNLGATISGAAINLNANSNFATNINTGTSTGAVNIGNGAAGAISLTSGSTISFAGTNATLNTTGQLQLPTTGSTGGLVLGGDTNLYRSAANTLATDDSFSLLGTGSNLTVQGTGTSNFTGNLDIAGTLAVGTADALTVTAAGLLTTASDIAINGGDLTTTATTFNLLAGATTAINIGPAGALGSITLSGGSADTGCTVDGTTGNLACTGNITGNTAGTVGYWSRSGTTLSTATAGDNLSTSGNLQLTSTTGTNTSGIILGVDTNLYRSAANTLKTDDDFLIQSATNSTTAFQVQNAAGTNIFNVDTTNAKIGTANSATSSAVLTIKSGDGAAGSSGDIVIDSGTATTTAGNISIGTGAYAHNITIGNTTSTSAVTIQSGTGNINFNAATAQFTESASTRTLTAQTRTTNVAGTAITISGGTAGSGVSAFSGGQLTLQGGAAAGTGNATGGAVTISGGAAVGTSTQGLVNLSTTAFTSASVQTFASAGTFPITAGNVDLYSSLPVTASVTGVTISVPDPGQATIGRVLYIAGRSGSSDFTLRLNAARAPIDIGMKANSTATLIWNGTDWTAAGASSSTDLQSAYNNTLTAAGGAEIVLNNTASSNGLTVRNNATTPIIGGILEAQTAIGSNLFSVNNNATEYATNGGAETAGATADAFPASTWDTTTGGTVDRWTTAGDNIATGQASVRVQTTTTNHGARNRINASLTSNLTYSVSFAIRGATNFSTLQVLYSPDGTTTGTTTCATAQTVTTGTWTRITCTFVASGTITSANSILIRQTDATARTFYIDNLSVNINASATFAADGSVDNAGAFTTNWTAFDGDDVGGPGTATAAQDTTVIYDTSGSARVNTSNHANMGIRNNLAITPQVSTQYLVSFYARTATGSITDLTVRYSRDGGTDLESCVDYNTQTIVTTAWTKVTCIVTSDGTTASNPDLIFTQSTAPGGTRSIYIDALSVTLNTNNSNNVQIGGANKGGPTTLLTLDRASSAPIAPNNDAYLGSMYYDTTSGRIQCYEADGWGACGSAPDNIVNLNPEFSGAVLNGTGVGTMSADFCGNGGGLSVNPTLCASGEARNYYKWTSPQTAQQTYSIYVTHQLPSSFKNFASDDTVQLTARTDHLTNGVVTYQMFRNEAGAISACGTETTVTTAINSWQTVGINGNESTSCGFTSSSGNAFVIFKINVKANTNATVYVGTLSFTTTGR